MATLYTIPGTVPPIHQMPRGCRFAARCDLARDICREKNPPLTPRIRGTEHAVRCWVRGDHDLATITEGANG